MKIRKFVCEPRNVRRRFAYHRDCGNEARNVSSFKHHGIIRVNACRSYLHAWVMKTYLLGGCDNIRIEREREGQTINEMFISGD